MTHADERSDLNGPDGPNGPSAVAIAALRARLDLLRDHVHLAPANLHPMPAWHHDPAVAALTALPAPALRAAVGACLRDDDPLLRIIGVHAVITAHAPDLLPAALASADACDDALLTTMALAAIGRLRAAEHEARLFTALQNPQLFWVAVESLSLLASPRAMDALRGAIRDKKDSWDRLDVVTVIGEVGGESATPLLIEVLLDEAETFAPIHGFAAQALGALGDRQALPALCAALRSPRITEKGRILWGLGALGCAEAFDDIAPFLTRADQPNKGWWRAEALKSLAACDPARAWPLIAQAAQDPFFRDDFESAIALLWAMGSAPLAHRDQAARWLTDALRASRRLTTLDPSWEVPPCVASGGDFVAGVTLRSLDALLAADLLPQARPEGFSHTQVVRHMLTLLVQRLRAQAHALAEPLSDALATFDASPPT
jgi:hypothetical protein